MDSDFRRGRDEFSSPEGTLTPYKAPVDIPQLQQSIGTWQVRRRKTGEHENAIIDNSALIAASKRIGSAGIVENSTSPWAGTIGGLTAANSRPTNIEAGGGDVSSLVMRTLQSREKNRPGQSTHVGISSQPKRLNVTMSPTSQFQNIKFDSSHLGPETSQGLMSQTSKSKYISRKEHKKQEELAASQRKTLRMFTHIKFFKDHHGDMAGKSRGDMGRTNCSTAASTMKARNATTGPSSRRNIMALTHS